VQDTINYLASYNITNNSPYGPPHTFGMLWFDIEGPGYWDSDPSANVNFLSAYVPVPVLALAVLRDPCTGLCCQCWGLGRC
jgi:hypothetical protein